MPRAALGIHRGVHLCTFTMFIVILALVMNYLEYPASKRSACNRKKSIPSPEISNRKGRYIVQKSFRSLKLLSNGKDEGSSVGSIDPS